MRLAAVMTTSVMACESPGCGVGGASSSLLQCGKARRRAAPRACRGRARPTTMPTWPRARSSRSPARTRGRGGDDPVGGRDDVEQRAGERGGIDRSRPPTRQCAAARSRRRANKSSNISRAAASESGGPSLAQSSSVTKVARLASPVERGEGLELGDGARRDRGSRRRFAAPPSAARRALATVGCGAGPQPAEHRRAPRPGSRRNARARRSWRRCARRPAPAAASAIVPPRQ